MTAANRAINMQTGPVVLARHSWGGVVITQAGNNPKVAALVYVSAFAPDTGQSINDLVKGLPTPPYAPYLVQEEGGYLVLSAEGIAQCFVQDLPADQKKLVASTQGPAFGGVFDDKITHAAWHDKPSWWVLSQNDRMIDPHLQETISARIQATVTKVSTSHVPMLIDPKAVAEVILAAAAKAK